MAAAAMTRPLSPESRRQRRQRIVRAALELIGEQDRAEVPMRRLADRCRLNVATIYHHFPSKAELLRAVVAERRYLERLPGATAPPLDLELPPAARLSRWLAWLWRQAVAEFPVWRLVLGEGLRGERVARASIGQLSAAVATAIDEGLAMLLPEITDAERPRAARVVRSATFAVFLECMVVPQGPGALAEFVAGLEKRADDVAVLVIRGAGRAAAG
jgi:AcrR family transcriptional regulator